MISIICENIRRAAGIAALLGGGYLAAQGVQDASSSYDETKHILKRSLQDDEEAKNYREKFVKQRNLVQALRGEKPEAPEKFRGAIGRTVGGSLMAAGGGMYAARKPGDFIPKKRGRK